MISSGLPTLFESKIQKTRGPKTLISETELPVFLCYDLRREVASPPNKSLQRLILGPSLLFTYRTAFEAGCP